MNARPSFAYVDSITNPEKCKLFIALISRFTSHAGVISAFGQHFSKTGKVPPDFHRYLLAAQDARTEGDYDIRPKLTADDSALAISRAHDFTALAERFLAQEEPPLARDRPAARPRRRRR
jgi:hypothetical protein